jgi:hypothetical protein
MTARTAAAVASISAAISTLVSAKREKQLSKDDENDVDEEDAAKLAIEVRSSEVNALCDDIGRQRGSQVKRI